MILHDPALSTDPELVRAASQATLLALENGRLEGELEQTIDALAASRAARWPPGTASAARSSATCTTARSNTWPA